MDWKNQLTKTPILVLFVILISVGVGTASALITITLAGDVVISGFLDMTGDKITNVGNPTISSDAATKEYVDTAPSGIPGVVGIYTKEVIFDGFSTGDNNVGFSIACDIGDFALAGGVADDNAGTPDEFVVKEFGNGEVENFGSNQWIVTVDFKDDSIGGLGITLHVVCLDFSPAHT